MPRGAAADCEVNRWLHAANLPFPVPLDVSISNRDTSSSLLPARPRITYSTMSDFISRGRFVLQLRLFDLDTGRNVIFISNHKISHIFIGRIKK